MLTEPGMPESSFYYGVLSWVTKDPVQLFNDATNALGTGIHSTILGSVEWVVTPQLFQLIFGSA